MESNLREQLEQFQKIPVPYRAQKQHEEKHAAYEKRMVDITHKFRETEQEAFLKMSQHSDSIGGGAFSSTSQIDLSRTMEDDPMLSQINKTQAVDKEELRIQGEVDFME